MADPATPSRRLTGLVDRHAHVLRYALALLGPMSVAASQFLVSLAMIHLLSPGDFGSFSFLVMTVVLSWGLCSALICAPLPVLLYQRDPDQAEQGEAMLFGANAAFALMMALIFATLALWVGLETHRIILFTGYGWASFTRYFARSHSLARHRQWPATLSDLLFATTLMIGTGLAALYPAQGGTGVYAALLVSALLGLLPFGIDYIPRQIAAIRPLLLRGYGEIWRTMSSWSVLGVITTEATNNAHAYLVTSLLGPQAFAPLAASLLVTRPVSVIATALSDFERPRLARQIGSGLFVELRASLRQFRLAIAASWAMTALAVAALFLIAPRLVFPERYDLTDMTLGAGLWMLVSAARLCALPPSCTLIACGAFRTLARTSLISGILTVIVVALLILSVDNLWSIVGLLIGQILYAGIIQRHASRWLGSQVEGMPPAIG